MDQSLAGSFEVNWTGLAALAVLVLVFAVILFKTVVKPDRVDARALTELGGRRGWDITRHQAGMGKGFRIEVQPRDAGDWSCLVTRYVRANVGSSIRTTEFTASGARLPAGMVVVGPGLATSQGKEAAAVLSSMGGTLEHLLLTKMLGEDAAGYATDLRLAEGADLEGATVFATPDAPVDAVLAGFAQPLADWRRSHRKDEDFPILIASATRLRLRLRTDATKADELKAFLGLALQVRALEVFSDHGSGR